MKRPLVHASVFSGIGGPEVAAAMLGWKNVFHCEINPFGKAVLDYWFPDATSYEDITKTDFSEWRGRIDVLTGGFPCQPFSYAGKRRGAEDDRYLWPSMFRCIDEVQPTWVVCENVAGILTMVEQGSVSHVESQPSLFDEGDAVSGYELRETFTLQRICDDLGGHGYDVQPVLIPACSVGAPHRRDRVFIVGHRIAADTYKRADGRDAGEHEGKSREERLQERDEVRFTDQPSQVRHEGARDVHAANASKLQRDGGRLGLSGCKEQPQSQFGSRNIQNASNPHGAGREESFQSGRGENPAENGAGLDDRTERPCEYGNVTYTSDARLQRGDDCNQEGYRQGSDRCSGQSCEVLGGESDAAHSGISRRKGADKPWNEEGRLREYLRGTTSRLSLSDREGGAEYECGGRWRNFPTVAPVHRGNDGIPFPLDLLAFPFIGKRSAAAYWRTESLKAYGNAIVPQVMYEIFRAIEKTYETTAR